MPIIEIYTNIKITKQNNHHMHETAYKNILLPKNQPYIPTRQPLFHHLSTLMHVLSNAHIFTVLVVIFFYRSSISIIESFASQSGHANVTDCTFQCRDTYERLYSVTYMHFQFSAFSRGAHCDRWRFGFAKIRLFSTYFKIHIEWRAII